MFRHTLMVLGLLTAIVPGARAEDPAKKATPNAQMQAVLDSLKSLKPKPIETLTPAEARKQPSAADAVKALLKKQNKPIDPEAVGTVRDIVIPGPVAALPARVYTPKGTGPFPVLVYWHGGGWVIADINTYDSSCRALCNAANCVVVSCDYRRAPENKFPAAEEDAVAAYRWVLQNAATIGGDARKVAVGGESAGGNLAAVVALRARDGGLPMPVYQLLVYPVAQFGTETASYREYADSKPLSTKGLKWFGQQYLTAMADGNNPYASPLMSKSFAKLPPATIITAEIDPLRDDGKMYADKLKSAGVKVDHAHFPGVTHEFFGMGAVLDDAKKAVAQAAMGLKSGFGI